MNRRALIARIGGAAAWPVVSRGQTDQPRRWSRAAGEPARAPFGGNTSKPTSACSKAFGQMGVW